MGRPIILIGSTRLYINDRLGRLVASQIDPGLIGARSRPGPDRPIPILDSPCRGKNACGDAANGPDCAIHFSPSNTLFGMCTYHFFFITYTERKSKCCACILFHSSSEISTVNHAKA